jgi:hypothetical protein
MFSLRRFKRHGFKSGSTILAEHLMRLAAANNALRKQIDALEHDLAMAQELLHVEYSIDVLPSEFESPDDL